MRERLGCLNAAAEKFNVAPSSRGFGDRDEVRSRVVQHLTIFVASVLVSSRPLGIKKYSAKSMHVPLLASLALVLAVSTETSASNIREAIQNAFAEVRELKTMRPEANYSVQVDGVIETGRREQFLRRRKPGDILASKLSSGCGDNAFVFLERIERAGFETLLVDSAEISSRSTLNKFSGHAVVAVREKGGNEKCDLVSGRFHELEDHLRKLVERRSKLRSGRPGILDRLLRPGSGISDQ